MPPKSVKRVREADRKKDDGVKRLRVTRPVPLERIAFDAWCRVLVYLDPWEHAPFLLVLTAKWWNGTVCNADLARKQWIRTLICISHNEVKLCGRYFHNSVYIGPSSVKANGEKQWMLKNQLHRDGDQPAIVDADGLKAWYQHGELHRDGDQPAVVYADGSKEWYQHGKIHREGDQPAVVNANGFKAWYQHGERHRDGDQPAVVDANGFKAWYRHGECMPAPNCLPADR